MRYAICLCRQVSPAGGGLKGEGLKLGVISMRKYDEEKSNDLH